MTILITFDGLDLTASGSMVNFPSGYPTVLNKPSQVLNTPSRATAIILQDQDNSAPFTGNYSIFGTRTQYDSIKAKEGTLGTLVVGTDTIQNVYLRAVSQPAERGGTFSCSLAFELVG